MSARRLIIAALSEDSMGGIATLHDVERAEQLVDAHRAEVLAEATPSEDYPGELDMLRGLVATLRVVAKHGDLGDVRKLLDEHQRDEHDAVGEARGKSSRTAADATPGLTDRQGRLLDALGLNNTRSA